MKTKEVTKPLTASEKLEYALCKKTIQQHIKHTFETGMALAKIKEKRLYREEFPNWLAFCTAVQDVSARYAEYLIRSVKIRDEIKKPKLKAMVTSETQTRALADFPEKLRQPILAQLKKTNTEPTPENITKVGTQLEEPIHFVDCIGRAIPENCIEIWRRRKEYEPLLTTLESVKSAIEHAREAKDPLWIKFPWDLVISDLIKIHYAISHHKPYTLCPKCQGRARDNCIECGSRGFIGKHMWDHLADPKLKSMIVAGIRKENHAHPQRVSVASS